MRKNIKGWQIIILLMLVCTAMLGGCSLFGKGKNPPPPPPPEKKVSFTIYRTSAEGDAILFPEKVTIVDNGKSLPENALITLVSSKPQDAKMVNPFPPGTKFRALIVGDDGTAYADFSKELANDALGSHGEMMVCYAIANTLTEFSNIKRVYILVDGQKVTSLGGHMDLEDPLKRNESMLKQ